MQWSRDFLLERFNARDASYDGRFWTGVFSTGIYCLPSCSARKPKPENVGFFETAEAARAAGLRACRRCRPDDFLRGYDPDLELADEIARALHQEPERFPTARAMAQHWGFSGTRWNEFAQIHFHRTPADLLNHWRVLRAQKLLADTTLRVLDVAGEAGFESPSAFHSQFLRRSAVRPNEFRALLQHDEFVLRLPANYPVDFVLGFLGRDPTSPTERVEDKRLLRAIWLDPGGATLELRFEGAEVRVGWRRDATVRVTQAHRIQAYRTAFRLLGLGSNPAAFRRHLQRLAQRGIHLPVRQPHLRIPQTPDLFEGLVWSIVGQQVNLAFAYTLRRRLIELFELRCPANLLAHPTAEQVAELDLAQLTGRQFSRRKAEYLVGVARALTEGSLNASRLTSGPATRVEADLLAQRGLGPWSTHYVMMRALGFGDCVPVGDTGLGTALQHHFALDERPRGDAVRTLMAPFSPYRSLATTHLWSSLGAIA